MEHQRATSGRRSDIPRRRSLTSSQKSFEARGRSLTRSVQKATALMPSPDASFRLALDGQTDRLAVEEPLEIRLLSSREGKTVARALSVTMRTPGQDRELAAGFLYAEGIIASREDLRQVRQGSQAKEGRHPENIVVVELARGVEFNPKRMLRYFLTTSACGVCGKTTIGALQAHCLPLKEKGPRVPASMIQALAARFREAQPLFQETGGVHGAALFEEDGSLRLLMEDVGRHNAVDKVIGHELLANRLPLSRGILVVSGRVSFEIIQKALMARIPIVAAVGAPSTLAVKLARAFRMTLIGFLGEDRFNIYAGAGRITGAFQREPPFPGRERDR